MATKQVYTASDGRKYKTYSQADAEKLAGKLQTEKAGTGVDPNMPTISLQSETFNKDGVSYGDKKTTKTFTDTSGKTRTVSDEDFQSFAYPTIPKISGQDSYRLIKKAGLTGLLKDDAFAGLTAQEADERIADARREKAGQTSALTSYNFNPATVTGAKKTFENFNAKLQDTNNDTWTSKGTKKEKLAGLYESTANEFSKLFDTPDQFDSLLNTNEDFRANMEAFKRAGGDLNAIRTRIGATAPAAAPAQDDMATQRAAVVSLVRQGITDPAKIARAMDQQGLGRLSADEVTSLMQPPAPKEQTTADYLAGLSVTPPAGTAAETDAFNSLIPERQLAQEQIMRIAQVPQQYKDLYFGTPEQLGVLEEKRIQAEERKKILEKQAKADERSLRAQANMAIDKNNADLDIEEAQVEENRLAAKNYATGMLAKMGALNTTGAAPVKLATLEQKYQQQAQQLRTTVRYNNQGIELKLKDAVSKVEIDTDNSILDLQSDLTKDKEEVLKEVQKLEQDAWTKIYSITDKAANELRTQREKYTKEAKALAEKNAKEYAKAAAAYSAKSISGKLGGKKRGGTEAERKAATLADYEEAFTPGQQLDDGTPTVDPNGFITVTAWKEAIKEAPSMGLTRSEFIKNFGYMLYADESDGLPAKNYGLTAAERALLK